LRGNASHSINDDDKSEYAAYGIENEKLLSDNISLSINDSDKSEHAAYPSDYNTFT